VINDNRSYIRIIAGTFVLASLALGTFASWRKPCFTGFRKWCLMEDILRRGGVEGVATPTQ